MSRHRDSWPRAMTNLGLAATMLLLAACSGGSGDAGAGEKTAASGAGVPDPVAYIRSVYASDAGAEAATAPSAAGADTADAASRESRQRGARESIVELYGQKAVNATPRLTALFEDDAKYARGEIGRLSFNYFTGTQERQLSEVNVSGSDVDGAADRKVVVASFKNLDRPAKIHYYFEKIGDAWFIDDVASAGYLGADDPPAWVLSHVLKYGAQ